MLLTNSTSSSVYQLQVNLLYIFNHDRKDFFFVTRTICAVCKIKKPKQWYAVLIIEHHLIDTSYNMTIISTTFSSKRIMSHFTGGDYCDEFAKPSKLMIEPIPIAINFAFYRIKHKTHIYLAIYFVSSQFTSAISQKV